MLVGTYVDGRDLTYDETRGLFAVGGSPVTTGQVLEFDSFSQIRWASAEIAAWARALPAQPHAAVSKPRMSSGAMIGIAVGALVGVILLGVAGVFVFRALSATRVADVLRASTPAPQPAVPQAPVPAPTDVTPGATDDPGSYAVVTQAEARDVVTRFLTLRAAKDIAGSKALCTPALLAGEDAVMVNDKYWNPDSFELTKFTPDQMYIHVTSMGIWPSGREATIFSVYREPESGRVLIDGFLDPEFFPEYVTP
ncbi:MAG: hypothetical protein Q7W16_06655 [Coriobacteriia bacterium]|nr:hypothetical protein [Coriobacteriia bacterium]